MSPCFLQHSTLPPLANQVSNFVNHEVRTMHDTKVPHNVWIFNNNHPTHKLAIACIINHNLYNVGGPYLYYGLHNMTMDVRSCNGCSKQICWCINCPEKNCAFERRNKYVDDVSLGNPFQFYSKLCAKKKSVELIE